MGWGFRDGSEGGDRSDGIFSTELDKDCGFLQKRRLAIIEMLYKYTSMIVPIQKQELF